MTPLSNPRLTWTLVNVGDSTRTVIDTAGCTSDMVLDTLCQIEEHLHCFIKQSTRSLLLRKGNSKSESVSSRCSHGRETVES
jgi:hypothetical protein